MTKQALFKKRVRERMLKTGERYAAARKTLLESFDQEGSEARQWVYLPDLAEDKLVESTGRGYNKWCDIIEAWDGNPNNHSEVATYLVNDFGVDSWWAQAIVVGFVRITGRREPYQRADGTFAASKSKTLRIDAKFLRGLLIDEDALVQLFAGKRAVLLSKPTAKTIRLGMPVGSVSIWLQESDNKTKISIEHKELKSSEQVHEWKFFWDDWCSALALTSSQVEQDEVAR